MFSKPTPEKSTLLKDVCLSFSFLLAGVPFQLQTHSNHLILKPARTDSILRKLTACASFKKNRGGCIVLSLPAQSRCPSGGGGTSWVRPLDMVIPCPVHLWHLGRGGRCYSQGISSARPNPTPEAWGRVPSQRSAVTPQRGYCVPQSPSAI